MAKTDTFFLRTTIESFEQEYQSSNLDITGYVDVPRGRVLVVDRAFITFSTNGQGPIVPDDVTGLNPLTRACGAQACSEIQTGFVEMANNSLFTRSNVYVTADSPTVLSLMEQTDALNPTTYKNGFIIPTNQIHCGINTTGDWNNEIDVGFLFEVHTERLSLTRIQELLVSLTAN